MNKERLLKLADHLEHGKLGHKVFDFGVINEFREKEVVKGGGFTGSACRTVGCALGECPIVWPDEWEFNGPFVNLKGSDACSFQSARLFFELGEDFEFAEYHLFFSDSQEQRYGGEFLHRNATKEQVAANIRAFVEKCGGS